MEENDKVARQREKLLTEKKKLDRFTERLIRLAREEVELAGQAERNAIATDRL